MSNTALIPLQTSVCYSVLFVPSGTPEGLFGSTVVKLRTSHSQVHSVDEVEAFTALSSALLINMGTLSSEWVGNGRVVGSSRRWSWYPS